MTTDGSGAGPSAQGWHPTTAGAVAHAWVPRWLTGGLEAVVNDAVDERWDCFLLDSGRYGPLTPAAEQHLREAGVTVVATPEAIASVISEIASEVDRRVRSGDVTSRPLLLLVGPGAHLWECASSLQRIAFSGKSAEVHLAVDERCRPAVKEELGVQILGEYRFPRRPARSDAHEQGSGAMTNEARVTERYYVASGPLATTVFECDAAYFDEGLTYGPTGAIRVFLKDGSTESITGTRYLTGEGGRLRADVVDGALEVIYLGVAWRRYPAGTWASWTFVEIPPDPDASLEEGE